MKFKCPYCEAKLKAKSQDAGSTISCKKCGEEVVVPGEERASAAMDKGSKKVNALAAASLVLAVFGIIALGGWLTLFFMTDITALSHRQFLIIGFVMGISFMGWFSPIIMGIGAQTQIRKSNHTEKGYAIAFLGALFGLASLAIIGYLVYTKVFVW